MYSNHAIVIYNIHVLCMYVLIFIIKRVYASIICYNTSIGSLYLIYSNEPKDEVADAALLEALSTDLCNVE